VHHQQLGAVQDGSRHAAPLVHVEGFNILTRRGPVAQSQESYVVSHRVR
jgi:hypothetical protein